MTKRKTPTTKQKAQKPTFNKEAFAILMFENIEERALTAASVLDGIKERLKESFAYEFAAEVEVICDYIANTAETASMATFRMKDA